MKYSIDALLEVTKGSLICKKEEAFLSVHFDTRNIVQEGACFFALKGQRDGHQYLKSAYEKRAYVLVVEDTSRMGSLENKITIIQVADVSKALLDFAKFWKDKLRFQTVAITGSVGKTSAKHFCSILLKDQVKVSPKSYNNKLGVSLSFLQMDTSKTLIQEVGTNYPGEIDELCQIVEPRVSVCTEVAWSHVEGLGDIQKIAQEKSAVYHYADIGLFNMDNEWTRKMYENFQGSKTITFSRMYSKSDICLNAQKISPHFIDVIGHILGKKGKARIHVAGGHYLTSIMTAIAVAVSLGQTPEEIWKNLPLLKTFERSSGWVELNKTKIFLDAYNANPCSMGAFLEYISVFDKECVLLIGDMLELGYKSSFFHQELGQKVGNLSFKNVFFVGRFQSDFETGLKKSCFKGKYQLFKEYNKECGKQIAGLLNENNFLAVKASRGVKLERVVDDLKLEVCS